MNKLALHFNGGLDDLLKLKLESDSLKEPGQIHHNLALLRQGGRPVTESILIFLLTAIGIWAADKAIRRQTAPDGWTRRLQLTTPAGTLAEQVADLVPALNFLTGDLWILAGRPEEIGRAHV